MRASCKKCGYEVYAVNAEDLLATVAADGGEISLPERDLFCPGCENPLDIDNQGGKVV